MSDAAQHRFAIHAAVAQQTTLSPTLAINERVNRLWAAGQPVYHMGFGESRFPVHPTLAAALVEHLDRTSYPPTQGVKELRRNVAHFYNRHFGMAVNADQVIVGPGSKALIFAALLALDGDVLLPTPSWVSYGPQARLLGRTVLRIPATPADHYALTLDALDRTVAQSTHPHKVLVLNSPSNPTGQMLDPAFLGELVAYCRAHNIVVLSDEIYALTAHGHRPHLSLGKAYPEGAIVFGGLSKHLSLGGWRLGVAVTPAGEVGELLMRSLRVVAGELWSSPTAPVQYAAAAAYGGDPAIEAYIAECAAIHAIRTQHVWSWLVEYGIPCAQPDGAFYLFPSFDRWRAPLATRGVHTSDDLAAYLLEHYQLATLPGTAFGAPAEQLSLRLATSYLDMETDDDAAAVLAAYRANPDPAALMADHHPATQEALSRLSEFVRSL